MLGLFVPEKKSTTRFLRGTDARVRRLSALRVMDGFAPEFISGMAGGESLDYASR
jgi:hypothetical protein